MPDHCGCRSTATSTEKERWRGWPKRARKASKKLFRIFDAEALTNSERALYFRLTAANDAKQKNAKKSGGNAGFMTKVKPALIFDNMIEFVSLRVFGLRFVVFLPTFDRVGYQVTLLADCRRKLRFKHIFEGFDPGSE